MIEQELSLANELVDQMALTAPARLIETSDRNNGTRAITLHPNDSPLEKVDFESCYQSPDNGKAAHVGYLLRVWSARGVPPTKVMVDYLIDDEEKLNETWSHPPGDRGRIAGRVHGPIDLLKLAMSRDVTLALTDPDRLIIR